MRKRLLELTPQLPPHRGRTLLESERPAADWETSEEEYRPAPGDHQEIEDRDRGRHGSLNRATSRYQRPCGTTTGRVMVGWAFSVVMPLMCCMSRFRPTPGKLLTLTSSAKRFGIVDDAAQVAFEMPHNRPDQSATKVVNRRQFSFR